MREVISLSGYRDYRAKKTYEGALSPYSFVAIKEEKNENSSGIHVKAVIANMKWACVCS